MIFEALARLYAKSLKRPKTAQIAITNRCNFNCQMCQRTDLKVAMKDMDFFLFEKILNQLAGVENIILTGWGEPLLHTDLFKFIKLCKAKGKNVRLTTNGSLLTDEKIFQLIASKLDAVTFSIDRIKPKENAISHAANNQIQIIKNLINAKQKQNSGLKIYLQSVFCTDNENDIMEIIDFAVANNVNRVRLTRLDARFHDFSRPELPAEKLLIKKISRKLAGTNVGLDFLPHVALEGWRRLFYRLGAMILGKTQFCLRALSDVYINEDGKATPCCALPNLAMGDILQDDLRTIWHNKKFKEFRENQRKYCGKCDVLSLSPREFV